MDEFVLQADDPGSTTPPLPTFMLQDANYNVMALVTLPTSGGPQVLSQYQYEPYGPVAAEDHDAGITDANENIVGHQGLFFHRLGNDGTAALSLSPHTTGLYYNRNRWYAPHLGRFLTRDPNATAQVMISALSMNGQTARPLADSFSYQNHFKDGMNLYGSRGSNPLLWLDPTGSLQAGGFSGYGSFGSVSFIMGAGVGFEMALQAFGLSPLSTTAGLIREGVNAFIGVTLGLTADEVIKQALPNGLGVSDAILGNVILHGVMFAVGLELGALEATMDLLF